jgi:environmental stress-induced protein Ves
MQVRRHQDYRRMAWKNGGGETAEIAIFPEDATLDTFDWRVSTATVGADGPFSIFPGVDRSLSVLQGSGLTLFPEARGPIVLATMSLPVAFPAELPVMARLLRGVITDFNVMTRRGRFRHHVSRMSLAGQTNLICHGAAMLIYLADGAADVIDVKGRSRVESGDAVLVDSREGADLTISPLRQLTVYVVDIWAV